MRTFAMFVGCIDLPDVSIHAGVEMELLSGGATAGTARVIVKSTLTGDVYRLNPMLVQSLRGMSQDAIDDLALDVECGCEEVRA